MDRRDFLKAGLGALATGLLAGCSRQPQKPAASPLALELPYLVPPWTGDSFGPMHKIRNGELTSVPKPHKTVPLVIVGGGLSALTAAYMLKDEDFLLLEREAVLGGNAKQGDYQGVRYALGSAYLVDIEEPFGSLYHALNLPLKPLPEPVDLGFEDGRFTPLESGKVGTDFERMKRELSKLLKGPDFPVVPLHRASAEAMKLDNMTFFDYLTDRNYSPSFMKYVDAYCFSALGGSVREISAYAGVNFYSEIVSNIYAFPGGNAYIAQRLSDEIQKAGSDRVMTGVSVYQIQQQPDGEVWVSYFNNADGELKTVACQAVMGAIPYFFASRIFKDLPKEEAARMRAISYGSYLVANLCFDQRVFTGSYDHWTPDCPDFTDMIIADCAVHEKPKIQNEQTPFVMTVYAPFRSPWEGRSKLLRGNQKQMAKQVADSAQKILRYPADSLKEVRMTRYGHQLLTSKVGLASQMRAFKKTFGPYVFCHSDGQSMASIESAVTEAVASVESVKALLAKGKQQVPR